MIRSSVALVLGLAGIAGAGVTGWQLVGQGKCCGLVCPSMSTPAVEVPQEPVVLAPQVALELAPQRLEVEALQASPEPLPTVALAPLACAPVALPTPCLAPVAQARVVGTPRVVALSDAQREQLERKNLARVTYGQKRGAMKTAPAAKSGALDPALLAKKQQLAAQTAAVAPVTANPKQGALEPTKLPPPK